MPKSLRQQLEEANAMIEARDEAASTPPSVRRAFMTASRALSGMDLAPWTIGAMWILEELQHPFVCARADAQRHAPRDLARAIFAFVDTTAAWDAICQGVAVYDEAAFAAVHRLAPSTASHATFILPEIVRSGLASIPGAGVKAAGPNALGPEKNSGNGWVLTLLDCLLSEYTWPAWHDASGRLRFPHEFIILKLPLAVAFTLYSAVVPRYGVQPKGATYVEQAMLEAAAAVSERWDRAAAAEASRSAPP